MVSGRVIVMKKILGIKDEREELYKDYS